MEGAGDDAVDDSVFVVVAGLAVDFDDDDDDVEFDAAATTAAAAAVAAVAAVTPGTLSLANHSAAVAAAGVTSLVRELRIFVEREQQRPAIL